MMYQDNFQFNSQDEMMLYEEKYGKDKENKDDDKEQVEIPDHLVYGVTIALCGFFLCILPFPSCQDWGKRMIVMGVSACANSLCNKREEYKKKEEDKK